MLKFMHLPALRFAGVLFNRIGCLLRIQHWHRVGAYTNDNSSPSRPRRTVQTAGGMKTRSKTASVVRILAANVIVLAVGIVILELVFGAWLNPDRLNRLNLLRNRIFKEDVSRLYPTNEPVITYSRDKYGLRGPYRDDPARIDILTVGGSTTDQRFISDGSTWQDVLQKGLASAGVPVGIANAGVDGHTTVGHIQAFDWWFPYVPRLKPKYILFYVGINDFDIDENVNFDEFMSGSIVGEIKNSSAIWHAVRVVRGIYLAFFFGLAHQKIDFGKVEWTTEPLQTDYAFMKPRLDAYGQRLRILVRKTHDFGSRPIFVTQPSRLFRLAKDEVEGSKEETSFDGRKINGVDYYHMKRKFDEETNCQPPKQSTVYRSGLDVRMGGCRLLRFLSHDPNRRSQGGRVPVIAAQRYSYRCERRRNTSLRID